MRTALLIGKRMCVFSWGWGALINVQQSEFRCQLLTELSGNTTSIPWPWGNWEGAQHLLLGKGQLSIPALLALGKLNSQGHLANNPTCLSIPSKVDHLLYSPAISLLSIYPRESLICVSYFTCTIIVNVALLIIAKTGDKLYIDCRVDK